MPTLVLTPRYTDDTQALWKAASALGWTIERLTAWRVPPHLQALAEPVLYAEALFGPMLAEQLGIDLLDPEEDWLVGLPEHYRCRHVRLTTLADARTLEWPAFVKPPNDKSFPAAVYAGHELPQGYAEDMPVLVSGVVHFRTEFRCFVLERAVRAWSVYARDGELQRAAGFASSAAEAAGVEAFMAELLADPRVPLPRATVVDIGQLDDGRWACVEQNAAWGAGIYGCDPAAVLEVIRAAAVPAARA